MKTSGLFNTDHSYNHNSAYSKETIRIKYLEHKIDKLYMITEALWLLLKEKSHLDDENLTELIAAIDMKDGHRDGKSKSSGPELIAAIDMKDGHRDGKSKSSGPRNCPKCGRVNSRKQMYCIYCGTFLDNKPFE